MVKLWSFVKYLHASSWDNIFSILIVQHRNLVKFMQLSYFHIVKTIGTLSSQLQEMIRRLKSYAVLTQLTDKAYNLFWSNKTCSQFLSCEPECTIGATKKAFTYSWLHTIKQKSEASNVDLWLKEPPLILRWDAENPKSLIHICCLLIVFVVVAYDMSHFRFLPRWNSGRILHNSYIYNIIYILVFYCCRWIVLYYLGTLF